MYTKPNLWNMEPSKERFKQLKKLVCQPVSEDFDIDEIHWVTDRIGITDYEGCTEAVLRGFFTINVAGEIKSSAEIQADIHPGRGNVRENLDTLATLIETALSWSPQTKVVVHCAMGMERSPLTVAWYLHTKQNKTLDEAYEMCMKTRESTIDRRSWINA